MPATHKQNAPESKGGGVRILSLAIAMIVLDTSLSAVAMPVIAERLGVSAPVAMWIAGAYSLAAATMLLPAAALGQSWGYRATFRAGLILSIAASFACALAPGATFLIVARLLQGIGSAAVFAVNGPLLRFSYAPEALGRGLGFNALIVAGFTAASPSIAAGVLSIGEWPWLFVIAQPLGLIALIGTRALSEPPIERARFDLIGAVLASLALGLALGALFVMARAGISAAAVAALVAGVAGTIALVRQQWHQPRPVIPLPLLRIPLLQSAYAASICAFTGQGLAMLALPFLLHDRHRFDLAEVGVLVTAWPVGTAVVATFSGRLADRLTPHLVAGSGMLLAAIAIVLAALAPLGNAAALATCLALAGAGFALFQVPNNKEMFARAPVQHSAGAGGMQGLCRLIGQTLGAAGAALAFRLSGSDSLAPLLASAAVMLAAATICTHRVLRGAPA